MKKTNPLIGIMFISLIFSSFVFSRSLMEQAEKYVSDIKKSIIENDAPWKATVPECLYEYEIRNFDNLFNIFEKWTGEMELFPDEFNNDSRSTTQDSLIRYSQHIYKGIGDIDIPSRFIQIHSPVKNQAAHGTCWVFGTVASFESAKLVQEDNLTGNSNPFFPTQYQNDKYDYSEQFMSFHNIDWQIYYAWFMNWGNAQGAESDIVIQDSNYDSGGNNYFCTYNLIRYGIPFENDFPYIKWDLSDYIKWNPTNTNWENNLSRSIKTLKVYDRFSSREEYINTIKEVIIKFGAAIVNFYVPGDFYAYSHGVYIPTTTQLTGGHCVNLVGWLDMDAIKEMGWVGADSSYVPVKDPFTGVSWEATEFWIIKNSWADLWGWNGYYVQPIASEKIYDYIEVCPWMIENRDIRIPYLKSDLADSYDFNSDNKVDQTDYLLLIEKIGLEKGDTNYDSIYDVSSPKDGKIDVEDVTSFGEYLNNLNK